MLGEPARLHLVAQTSGDPGGVGYMLVDGQGRTLPNQRALKLEQRAGQLSVITVEFIVDGMNVFLGGEFMSAIVERTNKR